MKKPVIHYSPEELATIRELEQAAKTYHPLIEWTPFQIELLKRFYSNTPKKLLEEKLKHSWKSIKVKASDLGLRRPQ